MQPTVGEAAATWIALSLPTTRGTRSVKLARQRLEDYLLPSLGAIRLRDLTSDDLRGYRLALDRRPLASRTVCHILADARCFLNWCVESGRLLRSPFPHRLLPRCPEVPPDRLRDEELEQLRRVPEPVAFILRLGLCTGLRWGEMCRARAEDVEGEVLLVHHTKTGRLRRVPLAARLRQEIARRVGRLCARAESSPGTFNLYVRRHSGLVRFHVHQLRHTFACRWLERGGSLAALQQILGHGSVTTTERYARIGDVQVRREAERVFAAGVGL